MYRLQASSGQMGAILPCYNMFPRHLQLKFENTKKNMKTHASKIFKWRNGIQSSKCLTFTLIAFSTIYTICKTHIMTFFPAKNNMFWGKIEQNTTLRGEAEVLIRIKLFLLRCHKLVLAPEM